MSLKEIYANKPRPVITFEVFPPKEDLDGDKVDALILELETLKKFDPALISVTYGAGGSNKDGSLGLVRRLKQELALEPMPHFTCVCSSREFVDEHLSEIQALGINNILALRGDEPREIDVCYTDFRHANELVKYVKANTSLSVAVAGYPEGHPQAPDLVSDVKNLKKKLEAGAEVIFTQLFFDNDYFFRYKELVHSEGIDVPIIPGVLPVLNFNQLQTMVDMCKVDIPQKLEQKFEQYKNDSASMTEFGIELAAKQCQSLIDSGVEGLHFYTLNKSYSVEKILKSVL